MDEYESIFEYYGEKTTSYSKQEVIEIIREAIPIVCGSGCLVINEPKLNKFLKDKKLIS